MHAHPRYRVENDVHCVDIRVGAVEQLFDNRDPAPFRERDLDPDLVEYLMDAAEDLDPLGPFKVVFWFTGPKVPEDVTPAFRAHFEYELEKLRRHRRRQRRIGTVALLVAIALLLILLSIAQVLGTTPGDTIRNAIREGMVILSWVALWRPFDTLIYDWLPVRRQRKLLTCMLRAPIEVRTGKGPDMVGPLVRPAAPPT